MKITDEHRSRIAAAYIEGRSDPSKALCCGHGAHDRCAAIVGEVYAEALRSWLYDETGCSPFDDSKYEDKVRQRHLKNIENLKELRVHEDDEGN